ncbi:MAG TPA: type II secretion system F family protein [Chlamydiales bacterium]|nr:type II secretion system F family protein [Chlamydiales bacterium]
MMFFNYIAINPQGLKEKGKIEAIDLREASFLLQEKGLMPLKIFKKDSKHQHQMNKTQLVQFTQELSKLLKAGLPLYESLLTLEEKYQKEKIHYILFDLCTKVRDGISFSKALEQYPESFDILYTSMVQNAEKSGDLEHALNELASLLSKQMKLKKKIFSSLLYPAMLSVFCVVMLGVLLFFIVPSLSDLFEGRKLHPLTRLVFLLSKIAIAFKPYLILGAVLLGFLIASFFMVRKVKEKLAVFLYKIPLFQSLLLKSAFVRFFRSFSSLLQGGVSYVSALSFSRKVVKNPLIEKELLEIEKALIEGNKLSLEIKKTSLFPPLVGRMIAIAEEGGEMARMSNHIAEIYQDELDKTLHQITTFLQPLLLLFLGAVVGLVVLAVLIPLTDVSSFISG